MNNDDLLCSTEDEQDKSKNFIDDRDYSVKRKRGRPKGSKNKVSKIKIKKRFGEKHYTAVRLKKYQKRTSYDDFDPVDKPKRALLISSLPEDTTESDLKGYDSNMINVKFLPKHQTNNKKQVLVEFKSISKSIQCKDRMDAGKFKDVYVHAQYISPHTLYAQVQNNFMPVTDHTKLFVTGFGRDVYLSQLQTLFATAANIDLVLDPETRKPYGYAFINYSDESSARQAHNTMQDYLYEGRALVVMFGKKTSPEMEQIVKEERSKAKNDDRSYDSASDDDDDDSDYDEAQVSDKHKSIKAEQVEPSSARLISPIKSPPHTDPVAEEESEDEDTSDGDDSSYSDEAGGVRSKEGFDYVDSKKAGEVKDNRAVVKLRQLNESDDNVSSLTVIDSAHKLTVENNVASFLEPQASQLNRADASILDSKNGDYFTPQRTQPVAEECLASKEVERLNSLVDGFIDEPETALDLRETFAEVQRDYEQTSGLNMKTTSVGTPVEDVNHPDAAVKVGSNQHQQHQQRRKEEDEVQQLLINRPFIHEILYNQFGFGAMTPPSVTNLEAFANLTSSDNSAPSSAPTNQNAPNEFDPAHFDPLGHLFYFNSTMGDKNERF